MIVISLTNWSQISKLYNDNDILGENIGIWNKVNQFDLLVIKLIPKFPESHTYKVKHIVPVDRFYEYQPLSLKYPNKTSDLSLFSLGFFDSKAANPS